MSTIDSIVFNVASFVSGLFLLEYGADKFIDHTAIVARRLNVSPTLVGLLTCGAEWEELIVIAFALSQNNSSLALGNLIGSSIANILASFSLGLLFIKNITFDRSSKIYATVLLVVTTAFVILLFTLNDVLKWIAGGSLIIAFVVYVVSVTILIYRGTLTPPEDDSDDDDSSDDGDGSSKSEMNDAEKDDNSSDEEEHLGREKRPTDSPLLRKERTQGRELMFSSTASKKGKISKLPNRRPKPLWQHLLKLLIGLGALLVSSYVIAYSANVMGVELGLSGTVVGTTILSLATTLPEKFVAILGGVRHQPGIIVANTVGSNIFLATLCGGILFLCGNVEQIKPGFTLLEALMMWASAALVFAMVIAGARRWMGVVCLSLYVAFLMLEFSTGRRLGDD